jgi:YidC/Oxa1 family membrane protein insertase
MIAAGWWQGLLNGLGWVLSHIYDVVHNYGLAIIILTLGIRLLLLPLGLKQIRSMQAMQALQPQIKSLQQKYKGNKQKLNEEMMKLYKERGVNPLAGCWPMLLQIPVLIALYSVLRFPQHPPHYPEGSQLRTTIDAAVSTPPGSNPAPFLGMNLLCNAQEAGTTTKIPNTGYQPPVIYLNCGHGVPVRIPYYVLGLLMVATMYYQQRQMQRAAPPGASQQQQALTRIMPLISIFWGFIVPSGVILYWTTSNLVQIGQQHFLLRAGKREVPTAGGDGAKRPSAARGSPKEARDGRKPATPAQTPRRAPAAARRGFFASMLERAEAERARRQGQAPPRAQAQPPSQAEPQKSSESSDGQEATAQSPPQQRPGGQGARSRKKRRKR